MRQNIKTGAVFKKTRFAHLQETLIILFGEKGMNYVIFVLRMGKLQIRAGGNPEIKKSQRLLQ